MSQPRHAAPRMRLGPHLAAESREALRQPLLALASSRTLIWIVGCLTAVILGLHPGEARLVDPNSLSSPFHNTFADLLASPAARWDSTWYLSIAKAGYHGSKQTVFFPLYPLLIASIGAVIGSSRDLIAGVLVSSGCAVAALYLLQRLVALETRSVEAARNAVWIFAWLPMALFLTAVYSEALFLLLTIGSFYAGRKGRWALAGLAGALAAGARNSGVLIVVPLLILYLYGPREDREPDRSAAGLRPRYRLRPDAAWLALVPVGLIAYLIYLWLTDGHFLNPFQEQDDWSRSFIPFGGVPLGIWAGIKGLVAAVPGGESLIGVQLSVNGIIRRLTELGFLGIAIWLLREAWRRLPLAYTAYAAIGLALAVSAPSPHEPMRSLPRFTFVLFPLWIALALWATERRRMKLVLVLCAPLLVAETILFTSWTWAA